MTCLPALTTHSVRFIPRVALSDLDNFSEAPDEIKKKVQCLVDHIPRDEILPQSFNNGFDCIGDDGLVQFSDSNIERVVGEPLRFNLSIIF